MFFVSKKKYNELKVSRERWKVLADRWMSHTKDANKLADEWQNIAVSCQEDNKRLVAHEKEMLTKMKELETELQGARQTIQQWADDFEELDIAYGELEIQKDRFAEERDFYADRATYLEGEVEDLEARIVDKDAQNAELAGMVRSLEKKRDCLKVELSTAISQRDYYYDLLESTSEVEEKDE